MDKHSLDEIERHLNISLPTHYRDLMLTIGKELIDLLQTHGRDLDEYDSLFLNPMDFQGHYEQFDDPDFCPQSITQNYIPIGTNGGGDYDMIRRDGVDGVWMWDHETGGMKNYDVTLLEHMEGELEGVREDLIESGQITRMPAKTGLAVDDIETKFIKWAQNITGAKFHLEKEGTAEKWVVEMADDHVISICFIAPGKNAPRSLEIKGEWLLRVCEPKPFVLIPHLEKLLTTEISRPREVLPGQFLFQYRSTELHLQPFLEE